MKDSQDASFKTSSLHPTVKCFIRTGSAPLYSANTYCCFSNYATEIEDAAIILDCCSGELRGVCGLEMKENGQRFRFPVHPRISSAALNKLLEKILPMAQQIVNEHVFAKCTATEREYLAKITEACEQVGCDPSNLDEVRAVNLSYLCAGKSLSEIWPEDTSVRVAANSLLSTVDLDKNKFYRNIIDDPSNPKQQKMCCLRSTLEIRIFLVEHLLHMAEKDLRENAGASLCHSHRQALVEYGMVDPQMDNADAVASQPRKRPRM